MKQSRTKVRSGFGEETLKKEGENSEKEKSPLERKAMITLWSLYNSVDKIQIDDLKTEQVRIVLLSIPTVKMKDWMICRKGNLHWQSILQVPDFYDDVRELKGDTQALKPGDLNDEPPKKSGNPAPPSRRPLFEDIDIDSEETLSLMNAGQGDVRERRSARRHLKALRFEVVQGGKTFHTETVDVSMSGMSLEEGLPEWAKKEFLAVISLNDHKMKLRVSRVDEDKSHTKLKIVDAEHWDVLRSWVVGW